MHVRAFATLTGVLLTLPAAVFAQTYNFIPCGVSGYQGPTQANCDTAYTASSLEGDVTVTGGIQSWTVPVTGSYRITAVGAAGFSATNLEYDGGRGARIAGTFDLTMGDVLQIVVGQQGSFSTDDDDKVVGEAPTNNADAENPAGSSGEQSDGGGGGGSFVVDNSDNPMLIAGGGGGTRHSVEQDGCDANTGQYATTSSMEQSSGGCSVKVDALGLGGVGAPDVYGSGGAGFNGDGASDGSGQGGRSWANGMLGGHVYNNNPPADGGFGGGGSGEGSDGGGGGGGYSGGDGGWAAGGGGSFNGGTSPSATAGIGTGHGSVTIELLQEGGGEGDTRTTFEVTKEFTDGDNPTEVTVTINCFTGLPLEQSQVIDETQGVTFVVTDFDDGELDCDIIEEETPELAGYSPEYNADGPGTFDEDGGCNFEDVASGSENSCHIVNDAAPVEVEIEKVWVIDGPSGDQVDTSYKLTLFCDAPIQDASYCHGGGNGGSSGTVEDPAGPAPSWECKKNFYGDDTDAFFAYVTPEYPESHCWVEEEVNDSYVEIDNDCGSLVVSAGDGDSCVITNSVFFEGIPTLNQYGMALLALLMLGVGVVGFRRFA